MAAADRINLPVGLFPGAGVALTPQEKEALARQELLDYQRQRREQATTERDASANRLRNGVFDFMEDKVGVTPEWANRAASAVDYIPILGDASGGEDVWQDVKAGNWKNAGIGAVATGIGIVPMLGDLGSGALKSAARAVPAAELRASARAGEEVAPVFRGLSDTPEVREAFHSNMATAKATNPHAAAVDIRPGPEDYKGERMFGTNEGSLFSLSPTGEINSVVKQVDEPNKALAKEALTTAKRHGGRWLSVFDTKIAEKYADEGFRPVKRMKFSEEYAPEGWDYDKFKEFNGGRPDVVFMEHDPEYKGGYKAGTSSAGEYTDNYDAAGDELTARAAAAEDPHALGMRVLEGRAKHMAIKDPKKRPQPDPEMLQMLTTPEGYDRSYPLQETIPTPPRMPEGRAYPKGDRARVFIDRKEEIAQRLAENMKPHLGTSAEYFYHTGPILEAAERAGMSMDEAREMFNEFGGYYAATSPRTETENNIRNASLARWKHKLGIPLTETIGPVKQAMDPKTKQMKDLMGEKGYPMMVGEARPGQAEGIHRSRLEELRTGVGLDMLKNTKPYTFEKNVQGNLEGATIDTHAIRGAVKALNEMDPGSVPPQWLNKQYREAYAADPSSLDVATMIDDKLEVDDVMGQTEYGPLSDVYTRAGEILGVPPAVAQSLGWFGSGADTGLGSKAKTVADLFDERVAVTAKELGMEPEEVLVKALRGQMPLLSIGGVGAIPLINEMVKEDEKRQGKQSKYTGEGGA